MKRTLTPIPSDATTYYTDQDPVFRAYYQSPEVDSHLLLDRQRDHIIVSFSAGDSSAGIYYKNGGTFKVNLTNLGTAQHGEYPNACGADFQSADARNHVWR